MSDRPRIGLDNPAFRGRLRQPERAGAQPLRPAIARQPYGPRVRVGYAVVQDVSPAPVKLAPTQSRPAPKPIVHAKPVQPVQVIAPQPYARPAHPKQQHSKVLQRRAVRTPSTQPEKQPKAPAKRSKLQIALVGMAIFIFITGLFVSALTLQTNKTSKNQVEALSKKASQSSGGAAAADTPPTESRPTIRDVSSYQVAPDQPKLIQISKLNVYARVKPMSVNAKNELQAPASIFDAGWYNGSAHPGDTGGNGAMLIDGHVHGPSLPGVFANIKKLVAGDTIQVIRGDNKTFTYTVVKTQNYSAANLDIGVALTSATPGKAALNLMTCGGKYDKTNGEYTERTVVFAVES